MVFRDVAYSYPTLADRGAAFILLGRHNSARILLQEDATVRGIIKTFDMHRGFGFITVDGGGDDYFFHLSAIQNPENYHGDSGLPVEFEATIDHRSGKKRAENVKILEIGQALPEGCRFESFVGADSCLEPRLFFEAPKRMSEALRAARVNPSQLRMLVQRFTAFAIPLKEGRMNFSDARERFGVFYIENLIRQVERKLLPPLMKNLIDAHRELIFSDPEQMLGFYRYLTNILCYFPERERESTRRGERSNRQSRNNNEKNEAPDNDESPNLSCSDVNSETSASCDCCSDADCNAKTGDQN